MMFFAASAMAVPPENLPAAPDSEAHTMESVIAATLQNNASLRAAQKRWHALQKRPDIARALPDPMLTYGHWLQSVETRVGAMDNRIALSQRLPAPGKRKLAATRAEKEALVAMWEYETLSRTLTRRARLAWLDRLRIQQIQSVLDAELGVLRSLERTALARYESGNAQQQDVIKVQLASTAITNQLHSLRQQEQTANAQLNALLNRPPGLTVPVSGDWPEHEIAGRSDLLALAMQYRQELHAAGVVVERDVVAARLARKERWPDITVGVDYTQIADARFGSPGGSGRDAVMGFFSINIPLWGGKLKAQEEEANLRLEASRDAQENLEAEVAAEVFDAWQRTRVAGDQIELYDNGLIPQAEHSLSTALASYQAAKGSFLDVLDAQRALLNLRLGRIMSQWDRARGLAELERAVGVDLNELNTLQLIERQNP